MSSDPDGLELLSETNTEKEISNIKRYVNDLTQYAVVLPRKLNKRIINQDGAFIICGLFEDVYRGVVKRKGVDEKPAISNLEDLRKKNKNGKRPVFLIKNKKKIISQLHTFGIEKTKIYPEIDDVAEYIQKHVNEI